ncbi:MAG: LamG domain-containing protein, partial [Candidatus Aenigmarchaeota archaeon]|nr:LamG domain-containing protein [Candidatus Aenigmarchaeota archaeon]
MKSDQINSNLDSNLPKLSFNRETSDLILTDSLEIVESSAATYPRVINKPEDKSKFINSSVGECKTPITIKKDRINEIDIKDNPKILNTNSNLSFILIHFKNSLTTRPAITPVITPTKVLISIPYANQYNRNVRDTAVTIPTKKALSSLDAITNNATLYLRSPSNGCSIGDRTHVFSLKKQDLHPKLQCSFFLLKNGTHFCEAKIRNWSINQEINKEVNPDNFSLTKVTNIYKALEENPNLDYYFLDSENNPIKVQKIEKVPYSGKIYDVDVENDIVLVRRVGDKSEAQSLNLISDLQLPNPNSFGIWSGNSDSTAVDISKYGNNGTFHADATWTTSGKYGRGVTFDGSGDYMDCGNDPSLNITEEITIEMWVKPDAGVSSGYFITKNHLSHNDNQYGIYMSGNKATYYPTGSPTSATNSIPYNVWTHVVFTRTSGTGQFYINGQVSGNSGACAMPTKPNFPVRLGCRWNSGTAPTLLFDGIMDEVRIYNKALSADEILLHYQSEFQKYNST